MKSDGWLRAFRLWLKRWRRDPIDPDWHDAYKMAFRAGWRAAMRAGRASGGQPVVADPGIF